MKKFIFLLLLLGFLIPSYAQNDTTITQEVNTSIKKKEKDSYFSRAWLPIGLMAISVDLMRDSAKYHLQPLARSFVADTFYTHLDDWLQYAPALTMYTADLFGVPAKNTVWNQTKFLIMSELITSGIVLSLKYGLGIQRPNNGAHNSYPSGHTAQAFVESQVLFNEFKDTAPLLAASGFLFSLPTAGLRILNNKHWVPDVLLGAGIAMLVTNSIYYFEPLKNWNPFKNMNKGNKHNLQMSFIPTVREDYLGGHFKLSF